MTVAIPLLESMGESGGKSSADRYIGSLISLTSTSGFRYEGILYMVDAENSNIALQNVHSFGTEGRKKDGREIPASDKVYEFIVFRGTDIKDLEVKSSPPARPDNEPEIISEQPQHTQHAAASLVCEAPITVLAVGTRPVSSAGLEPPSLEGSTLRLSQSVTSSSLWGSSPPPLGASDTILPLHSQKLFRSSSCRISERFIPPFYPFHPFSPQPFEVGHQWITAPLSTIPVDTPKEVNSKARSEITLAALGLHASTSDPEIAFISNPGKPHPLPCSSATVSSVSLSTKVHPFPSNSKSETHKPPGKIAQKTTTQVKSHILPPFLGRTMDMVTAAPLSPQAMAPVTINASSFQVHQSQSGIEHAYTVDPISGKSLTPIHRSQQGKEETKFSKAASRVPQSQQPKQRFSTSQPLLPLPLLPAEHKPAVQRNGSSRPKWQGRITGNVSAFRAVKPWHQFMEDFDFTTMNQLFNKEEIWSELGKDAAKEKDGNSGNQCLIMKDAEGSMSSELSNKSTCHLYMKHAYVKDEFFDDLSCNSGEEKVERVKFSERKKLDVETFGSCASRSHGGMRGKHATLYRNGGSARRERGGRTVNKYRPQNCGSKGHEAAS